MTVEPSGNVGIGIDNPLYALDVRSTGTSSVIARFNNDSTNTSCTLTANGGTLNCSSDKRLKKNIATIEGGLETLMKLSPSEYNWKYEQDTAIKTFGFIAQDVRELLPQLVRIDEDTGYLQLSTIGMIPIITQAIQEQNSLITTNTNNLGLKVNATTVSELQTLVNSELITTSELLNQNQDDIAINSEEVLAVKVQANENADLISEVQDRIIDMELAHAELMDFFVTINPDTLVYTDDKGNLTIDGVVNTVKLVAEEIETEKIETKKLIISDGENETIGMTIICPMDYELVDEECVESADDENKNNGKSVFVESNVIGEDTTIFTTFENNPGALSWVEKSKDEDGEFDGFTVNLEEAVKEAVKVNWWIVEKIGN